MTNILVFDVETTGLLPRMNNYSQKVDFNNELPYITQLSYAVYHIPTRQIIKTYNAFINIPQHVIISDKITEITGISREQLNKNGIDIFDALESFYDAFSRCDVAIAHNLEFDGRMIDIETVRNFEKFKKTDDSCQWIFSDHLYKKTTDIQKYKMTDIELKCTMKSNVDLCNIQKTNSRGMYTKYPTLCELYQVLFNETPANLHNSMMDVLVCLRCYLKKDCGIELSNEKFASYVNNALV
jgi:DNA polymerase III epsilon subunit-like protein